MTKDEIKKRAEEDLWFFANLVNTTYSYGDVHKKVYDSMSSSKGKHRRLYLLPRGHLKSHCAATAAAWLITKYPWLTVVYLSAGEDLVKDQVYAIKNILTSPVYKRYWPDMVNEKEGDREHWTAHSFNVDHHERKRRAIRDHTLIGKTVKSNFIGLHADVIFFDDVVVPNNAYSEIGRSEVAKALSQCSSILNPNGKIIAVGTRYHPLDAYNDMKNAKYRIWDEISREFVAEEPLWEIMEEVVEDSREGTGTFLWPRTLSAKDGNWYGFDTQTLEYIKADYSSKGEKAQFYSQYYNDPNDASTNLLDRSLFQYYNLSHIKMKPTGVYYNNKLLKVYAAMDVAWTDASAAGGAQADYTAIAVIGVDEDGYYYVLDLARFKTSAFQVYYDNVISLANKWGFRQITIESNAGGKFVAQEIEALARKNGGYISVKYKNNSGFGAKSKQLRQYAIVNPKYELKSVYHRTDGLFSVLEEELVLERPPHDDLVDALGMAMEDAKPPMKTRNYLDEDQVVITDVRFGGRRGR